MMIKKIISIYPLYILLGLYFIFSFLTYKNYGITADEALEYKLGKTLITFFTNKLEYNNLELFKQDPYLKSYYHFYPMLLNLINPKGYYEWFHLANLLFASLIIIGAYILCYKEYKNKYYAVIAPIVILLVPRFFGDIPANSKDMPFAVMFFLSLAALYLFNKKAKHNFIELLLIGILLGFTQSLRIIGYTLYFIYFVDLFIKYKKITFLNLQNLIVITIVAHTLMWLTWPYINENITNIIKIVTLSKNFTPWNGQILYLGQFLTREQRPWHYLFVWLLISTPVFITIMHFISFKFALKDNLLKLVLFTIYLNFIAYLLLNPVIYNGLRHFLYLLPLIAITAAIVIIKTINIRFVKYIYLFFAIFIGYQMFKLHPYEYIYFNPIAKKVFNIEKTFETDYWGISYKQASEEIIKYLEINNIEKPLVYACNIDYAVSYYSKGKFILTNKTEKANFIICDTERDIIRKNNQKIFSSIQADGITLNVIRVN